ncbi:MAG: hypothetical protein QM784_11330 [Polyangiaceae bacterium]
MSTHVSLIELDDASTYDAYNRVLPEALQLPSNRVRAFNVDVEKVIGLAMAAAKRLQGFEAQLRSRQGFPAEQFDRFGDYILALYNARLRYKFLTRPTERLPALNEAASRWRAMLLAEAKSLIERRLIKAERLKTLAGHHGYRNVANDLAGLAHIFEIGMGAPSGPNLAEGVGYRGSVSACVEADRGDLRPHAARGAAGNCARYSGTNVHAPLPRV